MKQIRNVVRRATRLAMLAVGVALVGAADANAQVSPAPAKRAFVGVSVGAQPRTQSLQSATSLGVYQETATFNTTQSIGNGAIIDISGGYRVWQNLYVGVGYSTFGKKGDSTVTASIPHPLFFDRPRTVSFTATNLEHREKNVYLQGLWFVDVAEKVDVAISAGVAFINVKQSFFSAYGVEPGTQDLNYALDTQSVHTAGGTVGFDATYMFRRDIGGALFARYVGGSVTIPNLGDVKAGGFQVGLGVRYRF